MLAGKGHDVVCLVRRDPGAGFPWPTRVVDTQSTESLTAGLDGCEAVAHLAIMNDFHGMYADRRAAQDGYVGLTRRVVDAANETGTRVGYVSSDWVFDGTGHLVDEQEPPNPVNFYGFMKAASELVVLERARAGFVARVGGVQGLHQTQESGPRSQDVGFGYFVLSLVDALRAGGRFTVWEDPTINSVATPIVAPEIGALLGLAVEQRRRRGAALRRRDGGHPPRAGAGLLRGVRARPGAPRLRSAARGSAAARSGALRHQHVRGHHDGAAGRPGPPDRGAAAGPQDRAGARRPGADQLSAAQGRTRLISKL